MDGAFPRSIHSDQQHEGSRAVANQSITPTKQCTKCGEMFPATTEFFYKKERGLYGLHSWCKTCFYSTTKSTSQAYQKAHRERTRLTSKRWYAAHIEQEREKDRQRYAENPQKYRAHVQTWRIENPEKHAAKERNRRALKRAAEGAHTAADIEAQYQRQHGKCYYCNCKLNGKYHVDHIVPLVRGGRNSPDNLVISCAVCNEKKHDRLPHEWIEGGRLL